MEQLVNVTFVSEWNKEKLVKSSAMFNWETGEVYNVEISNEKVQGLPTRVYIELIDGTELDLDEENIVEHDVIISSDKTERGYILGEEEEADCGVESCTGTNLKAYWRDGETTIVCSKGLSVDSNNIHYIL